MIWFDMLTMERKRRAKVRRQETVDRRKTKSKMTEQFCQKRTLKIVSEPQAGARFSIDEPRTHLAGLERVAHYRSLSIGALPLW
jgi:DNA replication initiation complex subunit (GINS family)